MRLREIRKRKRLTLQVLAAKAGGMSYPFLSKVERGKADPSLSTLRRLARALDVTVSELVKEPQPQTTRRARWR
jgi:transcriptional regulator with XRE-family HTH domain